MNMQPHDWLSNEDSVCFEDRASRLSWIVERMPQSEYVTFPGGHVSKFLFEEMRYSFVYGQYLASIAVGFAYIEHTIAALLYASGRDDLARANASKLIEEAHDAGWLSSSEYIEFNDVRVRRNPIVHFRPPLTSETIPLRTIKENDLPYSIIEKDARKVIVAAMGLLTKHSF